MGQFTSLNTNNSFKFGPKPMDYTMWLGTGVEEWNAYGTTIKSSYYDIGELENMSNQYGNSEQVDKLELQKNAAKQYGNDAEYNALTEKQNILNDENANNQNYDADTSGSNNSNIDPERKDALTANLASNNINSDTSTNTINSDQLEENIPFSPFDLRLKRAFGSNFNPGNFTEQMPYSYTSKQSAINEFMMTPEQFEKSYNGNNKESYLNILKEKRKSLENDTLFQGYSAIMNPYAIVRLYGVKKSSDLLNQKNERRFYEVDGNSSNYLNYSLNPTTSSLINWGNNDPYQRTPYSFSDFVFCKYWNIIPNNRLITLRRYAAPILDNLSFTGMEDTDSKEKTMFPPMATAVTYFGGESGNKLSDILKFSAGYNWRELEGNVWTATGEQIDIKNVATQFFGGGAGMFAGGLGLLGEENDDYNLEALMLNGREFPDPYEDGPYENRILGPVNRIDKIKARAPGINFEMNNLKIVFEYVGRPIGGINSKAVMLDILSNFLILGTGNAVFFGGAHRFKVKPAIFPFNKDILKDLYNGHGYKAVVEQILNYADKLGKGSILNLKDDFMTTLQNAIAQGKELKGLKNVWDSWFTDADKENLSNNTTTISTTDKFQSLSSAYLMGLIGIPYLKGMRAILTGDPVGDWHLTIGNPLNPIALIGNLICKGIEIECSDELGIDDFPTEWKITVNLEHGMARDKGAIESMFNRGAGRIYELPDNFELANANNQTVVDKYTKENNNNGGISLKDSPTEFETDRPDQYGAIDNVNGTQLSIAGDANTVFNKANFKSISITDITNFNNATINTRTLHSKSQWIGKTLK